MTISDDGYPMYFDLDAKINKKDLRLISENDLKKIKLTKKLEKDLFFCNLNLDSLVGLYCDKKGNIIKKIDDKYYMFKVNVSEFENKRKASQSDVQLKIEKDLYKRIKKELKIEDLKENPSIFLTNGKIKVEPDFYSEKNKVIGEIHSHIGKLKGSQPDKISSDILKMLLVEKDKRKSFRKIIAVCDEEEKKQLEGNSYLAETIRQFNVEVFYFPLTEKNKINLKKAMEKQDIRNRS